MTREDEMDHKPIAAGKSSFDLVDKDTVLSELRLNENTAVLDMASGAGNYSLVIAEAMGGNGMVYAVDLWKEGIEELNRRQAALDLKNIEAAVADVSQEIPLQDGSIDVCLIATAFHDLVEDGTGDGALTEAARVLKSGGRLVMVEFKKIDGPPGPPRHIRLAPEELDELVLPFGFVKEHTLEAGDYTYVSTYLRI